jgi:hypothetical protein
MSLENDYLDKNYNFEIKYKDFYKKYSINKLVEVVSKEGIVKIDTPRVTNRNNESRPNIYLISKDKTKEYDKWAESAGLQF